jgi:hypothetical protein
MTMTRVIADGEQRLRLEDERGRDIGWISGQAIGFRGLPGERRALDCAFSAYGALESTLGRHYFGWTQRAVRRERLQITRDGDQAWIVDGSVRVARLHRPSVDLPREPFAIELVLPSFASEGAVIAVAQSLATVVVPYLQAEAAATGSADQEMIPMSA